MARIDVKIAEIFYDNVDPRRRQELKDARMIAEDPQAMANLSPRFINRQFNAWKYPERLAMYNQSDKPDNGGE